MCRFVDCDVRVDEMAPLLMLLLLGAKHDAVERRDASVKAVVVLAGDDFMVVYLLLV
jgi:hypothetical protein